MMRSDNQNSFLNQLAEKFKGINLRFEFNEPMQEHTLCVGTRSVQPLKLVLNVKENHGKCEDGYTFKHFNNGWCTDGDMWGGRDTYSTSQSYPDWVTEKVHMMVATHLQWTLGKQLNELTNDPRKLCSALGDSAECHLVQTQTSLPLDDHIKKVYQLILTTFKIYQGHHASFEQLLEKLDDVTGSIGEDDSPFSLLIGMTVPLLTDAQIEQVMERIGKRIEDDVRRICQADSELSRQFPTLKKRMAQTAPKVGLLISDLIDSLHGETRPTQQDPKVAKTSKLIERYNEHREISPITLKGRGLSPRR